MRKLSIGLFATTAKSFYKKQIIECRNSWVKDCDRLGVSAIFCGGYHQDNDVEVVNLPNTGEDYNSVFVKQFKTMYYIWKHHTAEYYLLCGTDNYFVIDKLLKLVENFDPTKKYYAGKEGDIRHLNNGSIYFHSGGPGIILSHNLMSGLIEKLNLEAEYNQETLSCHEEWKNVAPSGLHYACDVALPYFIKLYYDDTIIEKVYGMLNCSHLGIYTSDVDYRGPFVKWKDIITCHDMNGGYIRHFHQYLHTISDKDRYNDWLIVVNKRDSFINNLTVDIEIIYDDPTQFITIMQQIVERTNYQYYMWLNLTDNMIRNEDWPQLKNILSLKINKISLCYQQYNSLPTNARICTDLVTGDRNSWLSLPRTTNIHNIIENNPQLFRLYYGDIYSVWINYDSLKIECNKIIHNFISKTRYYSNYKLCYSACRQLEKDYETGNAVILLPNFLTYIDDYYICCYYLGKFDKCWKILNIFNQLQEEYPKKIEDTVSFDHIINNTDFMFSHISQPIIVIEIEINNTFPNDLVNIFIDKGYKVFVFGNYSLTLASLIHSNPVVRPYNMRGKLALKNAKYILSLK